MRLWRCHLPSRLTAGAETALPDALAHRLQTVLRVRVGESIRLFDGAGNEHLAQLTKLTKSSATAVIGERIDAALESPLAITLGQGICRGEKMDLVIQKATELGVARIVPLDTERVEVRLEGERLARRIEHWQQVAISAAEQSGRGVVPEVAAPVSIAEFASDEALVLDPAATGRVQSLPAMTRVSLIVGPEGGLTEREVDLAVGRGATALRLGPRTLRTETAGLAAIAALQSKFGDL